MPYTLCWHTDKHVLEANFWGHLTEREMHDMSREAAAYFYEGEAPLYLMIEMSEVTHLPRNFKYLVDEIETSWAMPRLPDRILLISGNPLHKFFYGLVSRVLGVPITTCKTREERNVFFNRLLPNFAAAQMTVE